MDIRYINIYNNLIDLTRNKDLYDDFKKQDIFSDRLIYFLLHFAFFLKTFKTDENKKILQEIYDYLFRQLELSIREIGYGDQSINKKMKDYINLLHSMIDKIHNWEHLKQDEKSFIIKKFVLNTENFTFLVDYFDNFRQKLLNNTLNSYIKGVDNQ